MSSAGEASRRAKGPFCHVRERLVFGENSDFLSAIDGRIAVTRECPRFSS